MLAGHGLSGTLPSSWTRLQQLRVLDLSRNSLTGSLPSWYVSMRQLAILKVHGNQLVPSTGGPEFYEHLLERGYPLQCLCVADNAGVLVDAAAATRLQDEAAQRVPTVPLVIDSPDNSTCGPMRWK
jgi:hypothetical protein